MKDLLNREHYCYKIHTTLMEKSGSFPLNRRAAGGGGGGGVRAAPRGDGSGPRQGAGRFGSAARLSSLTRPARGGGIHASAAGWSTAGWLRCECPARDSNPEPAD